MLVESDQSVSPAQIGAVVADPLGQKVHQPGLLDGEHEVLWIRHRREIQCHGREHRPRGRLRGIGSSGQDAVEAAMVEQPNRLTGNPIRAPLRVGSGQRLQHDGPHTGQSEFTRQHQPIRAGTGDDDVIHLAQLNSQPPGYDKLLDYIDCRIAVATARPSPITAGAESDALSDART